MTGNAMNMIDKERATVLLDDGEHEFTTPVLEAVALFLTNIEYMTPEQRQTVLDLISGSEVTGLWIRRKQVDHHPV